MLSHATARDWLIPYADGMLAADERRRVNAHIAGCATCAAELHQVRELNLLLVSLPPAPPVAFAPFWLKLQAVLPQRRSLRMPRLVSYRRAGLAFAIAALAVLAITGTALAAPAAMPDSPLYPVKQLEEDIQLATAPASARLGVEISQANERLHEATVMAANHKPLLAAQTLRSFQLTVNDATAALRNADPRIAKQDIDRFRAGLAGVERENATKDDDASDVQQLVTSLMSDLDQITEDALVTTPPQPVTVVSQPSPDPTRKPTPKPTPRPQPSDRDR